MDVSRETLPRQLPSQPSVSRETTHQRRALHFWMFHVKHLEEWPLPRDANLSGIPNRRRCHFLNYLVGSTVSNPAQCVETQLRQAFRTPTPGVVIIRRFGNDQDSPDLQKPSCALGGDRRASEGASCHKVKFRVEFGQACCILGPTSHNLSVLRRVGPLQVLAQELKPL